ncbi:MAG: sodium:solute symporter [Bacteroidetes bacterium]|nr:sodium:solute symporter [Bacteroidota bacterium]
MTFSLLDGIIVLVYLGGIALFGVLIGGKQRSARDYFVSERAIPWWAICLTIVATETSALTFLSLPGVAFTGSMVFLQLAFGYILGRIAVAVFLIPRYFEGEISTAYSLLEKRFSPGVRRAASGVFMLTRLFADGVRLYTTAIPLALLIDGFGLFPGADPVIVYLAAMSVLTMLTLVYVFYGGIRAVIWTDVVQWVIYILGAAISLVILFRLLPGTPYELLSGLAESGKLRVIQFLPEGGLGSLLTEPYTLISGLVGGMVLSMASHGTDQLIVQRVLAAGATSPARKAMVMSGVVILFQFAAFLLVGALLSLYFQETSYTANEVFAAFILHELPQGVTGLIVAGILAAAMSTLSSSISALSSATMMDLVIPLRSAPLDDSQALRYSRAVSLFWAIVLLLTAVLFVQTPSTVVELALSIASYTYGGLLGLFFLSLLPQRIRSSAVAAGFFAGIAGNGLIILLTPLAWTWYTLTGALITIGVALFVQQILAGMSSRTGDQS